MEYMDFLKGFSKRMKNVGRFAVLVDNSRQKVTWKKDYEVNSLDEQMNLIFSVLLFVMEYSLKEENCTIDDITVFLEDINNLYYNKNYNYEKNKELAVFIVDVILGNSGSAMYFNGYDYENRNYKEININYISNKVVYLDNGVRRTSYRLTDEGYNMILSTMELENNLKLTVHEMLFKMHLEKADYGRAVDDIKNVFEQLRIQNQKIQEAMHRIRQNALSYTIEEYQHLEEETIGTIEKTRAEFRAHQMVVDMRVKEFEMQEMDESEFNAKDQESLANLRIISGFLTRSLDEHQRILGEHFDLKSLYDRELQNFASMTMVQRFNIRSEIYDRVLMDINKLEGIDEVFKPLYLKHIPQFYNINKAFEYQKKLGKETEDDSIEIEFDIEKYEQEQEEKKKELLAQYNKSCASIMSYLYENQRISLSMLNAIDRDASNPIRDNLIPTAEIFREVIIEFITAGVIDIHALRQEQAEHITEQSDSFQLNEMLLSIIDENNYNDINKIYIDKVEGADYVIFNHVKDNNGNTRRIKCTDVELWYE